MTCIQNWPTTYKKDMWGYNTNTVYPPFLWTSTEKITGIDIPVNLKQILTVPKV